MNPNEIPQLARSLRGQLSREDTDTLVTLLIGRQGDTASPEHASAIFGRAVSGLRHCLNEQPISKEALDVMAAALFLSLDTFWMALETAKERACGCQEATQVNGWGRALHDALNLRDHLQQAVSDDFDWGDQETPSPTVPEQRMHPCVPCQDCGKCSCFAHYGGLCETCYRIRQTRAEARADIARWKRQLEAGCTYAYGLNANRLHRWDCPSLNTVEKSVATLEEGIRDNPDRYGYWPRLPDLFTAEELRAKKTRKKRCQMCGPDPL